MKDELIEGYLTKNRFDFW